jgi:hypothetical protein
MRLVNPSSAPIPDTTPDRSVFAPRKAYQLVGTVVHITEQGREMLLQWKSRDGMWEQRTFVVLDNAVNVASGGDITHWRATSLTHLEQGNEVTIDYLPLGAQWNLALLVRGRSDENTLAATNTTEAGRLQIPDEAFGSFMADMAFHRIAEKKACA